MTTFEQKTGMSIATVLSIFSLVTVLGGGGWWFRGELGMKADTTAVAAALVPIQEQIDDVYDGRIEGVIRQLAEVEARINECVKTPDCASGKSIDIDRDRLKELGKEYERLKKLQKK